jgi:hypothetical protein
MFDTSEEMRDVTRFLTGLAAFLALLALPPAVAIGQGAPPDSELDQYVPDLPGGAGDHAVGGGPGGSSNGDSIPPSNLEQLRSTGPVGESAADFFVEAGIASKGPAGQADASEGSQETRKGGNGDDATSVNATSVNAATAESQSLPSALLDALAGDGDEGMGVAFPFILGAIAAGGAVFVLTRRVDGSTRRG